MKTSDEELNQLLNSVKPVPPRIDLAQRIIAQASLEVKIAPKFGQGIKESAENKEGLLKQALRSFIFPQPAYALACSMFLGVLLGWQNSDLAQANLWNTDDAIVNALQVTSVEEDLSSLFLAEVNYYE